MFDLLLILVLAAHLLAANVAVAAPFLALWLDVCHSRRGDELASELGRTLLRQALLAATLAVLLGFLMLAVVWQNDWESFAAAASRVRRSRYLFGIAELAFYFVCIAAYLALWNAKVSSAARVWFRRALGLAAATNLAYHFPLLFTAIGVYGGRDLQTDQFLNFRAAIFDPEVVSQVLHHLLAAFAVAGIVVMLNSMRMRRLGRASSECDRVATWGGRIALLPTVVQLFVGLYVLWELPEYSRASLLGGDKISTILFCASLVGAVVLMHILAGIAFGEVDSRRIIISSVLLVGVVVAMVASLHRARQAVGTAGVASYIVTSNCDIDGMQRIDCRL